MAEHASQKPWASVEAILLELLHESFGVQCAGDDVNPANRCSKSRIEQACNDLQYDNRSELFMVIARTSLCNVHLHPLLRGKVVAEATESGILIIARRIQINNTYRNKSRGQT